MKNTEEQLLNIKQVAEYLNIAPRIVKKLIKEENLPCYKITNKTIRFNKDKVVKWTEKYSKELV
jgi:excisionase family DNA binding protein